MSTHQHPSTPDMQRTRYGYTQQISIDTHPDNVRLELENLLPRMIAETFDKITEHGHTPNLASLRLTVEPTPTRAYVEPDNLANRATKPGPLCLEARLSLTTSPYQITEE